jgi:hypothetical protein
VLPVLQPGAAVEHRLETPLAHSMPKNSPFNGRSGLGMAVVFFGRRSAANTNANGEHQTPSWIPLLGMSIRALSNARTQKSPTQFVDES